MEEDPKEVVKSLHNILRIVEKKRSEESPRAR
jgi:hypothetical protein